VWSRAAALSTLNSHQQNECIEEAETFGNNKKTFSAFSRLPGLAMLAEPIVT